MPAQYPAANDNEWSLLKKLVQNTALLSAEEAGDVTSVNGRTGAVVLSNSDVGLGNVTNVAQAAAGDIASSGLTSPTARVIGRSTAGTGAVEELTAAQAKTLLSLNNVENTALSTWAGTTNITTLGTVSSGTWNGSLIAGQYGGTGVNNSGKTITLAGNLVTSGAFSLTLTTTNTTNVTLPTSGTLATTAATVPSIAGTSGQALVNGGTAAVTGTAVTISLPTALTGITSVTAPASTVLALNGGSGSGITLTPFGSDNVTIPFSQSGTTQALLISKTGNTSGPMIDLVSTFESGTPIISMAGFARAATNYFGEALSTGEGNIAVRAAGPLKIGTAVNAPAYIYVNSALSATFGTTGLTLAGTVATSAPTAGSSGAWKLGTYTADVLTTQTGVILVQIGASTYKLLCSAV